MPLKVKTKRMEKIVAKALKDGGINGGCWNTILYGQLPSIECEPRGL